MARIDDGFSTTITLSGNTSISLWEKEVVPPGIIGGGPIDTTTLRNTTWRTAKPKQLKTVGNSTVVAAFDVSVYEEIVALTNINQRITVNFPDDSALQFYGFIDEFSLNPIVEGLQPTALMQMVPTNTNDAGSEVAPIHINSGDYGHGVYGTGLYLG